MPGWNIHLEVGERIASKLKLSSKEKEEFLLGCVLPDINNGYINNVKIKKEHKRTHWAFEEKSSLNFFEKYKEQIEKREPIYLGYLVHLYTDGYFNYDFYRNIKKLPEYQGWKREELRKIKHNDFWIFDSKFNERRLEISDKKAAVLKANQIEGIEIDEEEVSEVEGILRSDDFVKAVSGRYYQFYDEKRLDQLMGGMISSFSKDYLDF